MISKKAQLGVGMFIMLAIGAIVALVLLQGSLGSIGTATTAQSITNKSGYTLPASGSCKDLVGQELLSTAYVINRSSATTITSNITISEGVSSIDGLKRIRVCSTGATFGDDPLSGLNVNITYTFGPEGYADDAGARAIISIIILLAAIAIAIWVVVPSIKEKFGAQ